MPSTSSKRAPTQKTAAPSAIAKKKALKPKVFYIVGATGTDFSVSDADVEVAGKQRAKDHIWQYPARDTVVVNGYAANDDEGGDRHMQSQLMHYLASKRIQPLGQQRCMAFTHTSNLKLRAEFHTAYVTDGSLGPFAGKPLATVLKFDTAAMLKAVLAEERKSAGFFAPFAQSHVQKTLHVAHNTYATTEVERGDGTRVKFFSIYLVKLRILTGFGIMTARGELKIREPLEHSKRDYEAHINWHSWGFTAEDAWNGGATLRSVGHPHGF